MERYQIILSYDGTDFLGSQRQISINPDQPRNSRTIQGELEKALRKLGWQENSILLAGRTDTGTHAVGQVAAFDLDWPHTPEELVSALNANLPMDMAVRMAQVVSGDFHPRYDATSRSYRYRLFCQPIRDPLRERLAWRVWPPVTDLTPLASIWLGAHDFAAFGTPPRSNGSTIRNVMNATWRLKDDEWIFEIRADAFLYRMIRRLVFIQVAVGQGRITVEALVQSLIQQAESTKRLPSGLAPACGLTLIEVRYDNLV
jgi:tRNA pseudouridine38-40 synthase